MLDLRYPEILALRGFLDRSGNYNHWLCFSTQSLIEGNRSEYQLELVDLEGRVINKSAVKVFHRDDPDEPFPFAIRGTIGLRRESKTLRLTHRDIVLWETDIPEAPSIKIESIKSSLSRENPVILRRVHSATFTGAFMHIGYQWGEHQRQGLLFLDSPAQEVAIDLRELPGGDECRFMVDFSNGVRSVSAMSTPFNLPLRGPRLTITTPQEGLTLLPGQPLELAGQVVDAELPGGADLKEDLTWWLGDKKVGQGPVAYVIDPPPGNHQVSLRYEPRNAVECINVTVKEWQPGMSLPASRWEEGHGGVVGR